MLTPLFVGIAPFWGFQTLLAISLAVFFRLNKLISFAASNISIPPMIPFILYGSLKIGSYFVSNSRELLLDTSLTFDAITNNLQQYVIGSLILASIMAVFFGTLGFLVLNYFSTFKNKKN